MDFFCGICVFSLADHELGWNMFCVWGLFLFVLFLPIYCSYSVKGRDWGKYNAVYIRIGVCLSLFDHQEYKILGLCFLYEYVSAFFDACM